MPGVHTRRPGEKLSRTQLAARPIVAGNAPAQPQTLRPIQLQAGAGQTGGHRVAVRQHNGQRRHDGRTGSHHDLCPRDRINARTHQQRIDARRPPVAVVDFASAYVKPRSNNIINKKLTEMIKRRD